MPEPGEAARLLLALVEADSPSEEERLRLARLVARSPEEALEEAARRVAGDTVPDTVVARTAVEAVVAALALHRVSGARGRLRVVVPQEPHPGWQPLRLLVEELAAQGLLLYYEAPMRPRRRPTARDIAIRAARLAKGFSAKTVDVTDAPPPVVAGLYSAGVRTLTVLAPMGYIAYFQRFHYTLPLR